MSVALKSLTLSNQSVCKVETRKMVGLQYLGQYPRVSQRHTYIPTPKQSRSVEPQLASACLGSWVGVVTHVCLHALLCVLLLRWRWSDRGSGWGIEVWVSPANFKLGFSESLKSLTCPSLCKIRGQGTIAATMCGPNTSVHTCENCAKAFEAGRSWVQEDHVSKGIQNKQHNKNKNTNQLNEYKNQAQEHACSQIRESLPGFVS